MKEIEYLGFASGKVNFSPMFLVSILFSVPKTWSALVFHSNWSLCKSNSTLNFAGQLQYQDRRAELSFI